MMLFVLNACLYMQALHFLPLFLVWSALHKKRGMQWEDDTNVLWPHNFVCQHHQGLVYQNSRFFWYLSRRSESTFQICVSWALCVEAVLQVQFKIKLTQLQFVTVIQISQVLNLMQIYQRIYFKLYMFCLQDAGKYWQCYLWGWHSSSSKTVWRNLWRLD